MPSLSPLLSSSPSSYSSHIFTHTIVHTSPMWEGVSGASMDVPGCWAQNLSDTISKKKRREGGEKNIREEKVKGAKRNKRRLRQNKYPRVQQTCPRAHFRLLNTFRHFINTFFAFFSTRFADFRLFYESVSDRRTDGPTDGRTHPLIEMRGRI